MNKTLRLHRNLYSEKAVQSTIYAFKEIARISCRMEEAYYVLTFDACRADAKRTMQEFGNFALAETIRDQGGMYD